MKTKTNVLAFPIYLGIVLILTTSCSKHELPGMFDIISAGGSYTLAIDDDGSLWTWGENTWSQLGDGEEENRNSPQWIGSGYIDIAAGKYDHSLALKSDGTLWAWGANYAGQLGIGELGYPDKKTVPIKVGSDYLAIAAGSFFSFGLKTDGSLWGWGDNGRGELGNGSLGYYQYTPIMIGEGFSAIAAGDDIALALKIDGTLLAWGGRIGYNPVLIGSGFSAIAAGSHYLAVKTDGSLWAWGPNSSGQLGDGTFEYRNSPVLIGSGYLSISAGYKHTLAIKTDSTLWAWGNNEFGQLGDGTFENRNVPVQIGSDYRAISAGGRGDYCAGCLVSHSMAIKTNGTLWVWGNNEYGQLGDGTNIDRNTPFQIGSN